MEDTASCQALKSCIIVHADEKLTAFVELEAVMAWSERLSFNHAAFAFALFSRRQDLELLGAVSPPPRF